MGVVWQGHEGDAGATFTTGSDPEMMACAAAAKELFNRVESSWRSERVSGVARYDFAAAQALLPVMKGCNRQPIAAGHLCL